MSLLRSLRLIDLGYTGIMAKKGCLSLTDNARTVLEARYLLRDDAGRVIETPEQLFRRVAESVAAAEKPHERGLWAEQFLEAITSMRFLPNSPTLMNAGKPEGQLSACFVLPIEDSLGSIFETLKNTALIHQSGGGTGFSFSKLRPKGSRVKTTQGVASGPVSFLKIFDGATETIKQGGTRRGANMGILRVDHPDIDEFIDSKRDFRSITNFNLSVGVTDAFVELVLGGDAAASARLDRMALSAWECGDPGVVFLDRINRFNPTPEVGAMESTNPCGEQPLLPYESCNLGSLNLGAYVEEGSQPNFDWEAFRRDIRLAVRFLDDVIDVNRYPVEECEGITRANRKVGLGVMGFADALLLLGIPYDSAEARAWGEKIMSFMDREAKAYSAQLAQEKGPFPNFRGSIWESLGYPPMRNATVSTVAPTGTISLIAGASSGIEPIFSGVLVRNVLGGKRLVEVHPALERWLRRKGIASQSLDLTADETVRTAAGPAWMTAREVSVVGHLGMQAAFQRHSDSAVSKTINLPESAAPQVIREAYLQAWRLGCKGVTVYRDRSRPQQVLESGRSEEIKPVGEPANGACGGGEWGGGQDPKGGHTCPSC